MSEVPPPPGHEEASAPPLQFRMEGVAQLHPEYVNVVQVNHDPYTFQLTFGRFLVSEVTTPEQREESARSGLPTHAVCNLIVAASVFRDFVEVMRQQLAVYEARFGPVPDINQLMAASQEKRDGNDSA